MKKVVTHEQMQEAENKAIVKGISIEELMERAGHQTASAVQDFVHFIKAPKKVFILAGKGNNGGDGYTAGRELAKAGFQVEALEAFPTQEGTLADKKKKEFLAHKGTLTTQWPTSGIILDALFGTGFTGSLDHATKGLIEKVNSLRLPIVSIDIPSGLSCNDGKATTSILANLTLAIEWPKVGYYFNEGYNAVGVVRCLPIGLEDGKVEFELLEPPDVIQLMPPIKRSRHKYEAGHVVGLAGSSGMCGAAMMASLAALKGGAGIVHLILPEKIMAECGGAPWEIVRVPYSAEDTKRASELVNHAGACFVGPGLGKSLLLTAFWDQYKNKSVIDADGLAFLSEKKEEWKLPGCILTPHIGEMNRLLGTNEKVVTPAFIKKCREYVHKHETTLILKGGPSFLFSHDGPTYIMATSDPGMATAGSGDVLTGILAAMLAQKLKPIDALKLGCMVHGLAGIFAAAKESSYAVTATSILHEIGSGWNSLLQMGQPPRE